MGSNSIMSLTTAEKSWFFGVHAAQDNIVHAHVAHIHSAHGHVKHVYLMYAGAAHASATCTKFYQRISNDMPTAPIVPKPVFSWINSST